MHLRGRHFFANPGPTNIPDSVMQAVAHGTVDFMGPDFLEVYDACVAGLKRVLRTSQHLFMYTGSGHAAWEATLANLLSPGDRILILETGHFSEAWGPHGGRPRRGGRGAAGRLAAGVDYAALRDALGADASAPLKAVCAVHNETSTGMTLDLRASAPRWTRRGTRRCCWPTPSPPSARSTSGWMSGAWMPRGRQPEGADAAGRLQLHRGVGEGAGRPWAVHPAEALLPLEPHAGAAAQSFIGTVPVALFYGLREALRLIEEEGLENVLARHARLAEAVRRCVRHWSGNGEGKVELFCRAPERVSDSVTSILLPEGHDAEALRRRVARLNVALGAGLGRLGGKVFRIGHLGDLNEPMVLGTLAATRSASGWKACRTRRAGWMRRWAGWRRRPPDPPPRDREGCRRGRRAGRARLCALGAGHRPAPGADG
jgi:alanine-glyoxylate transaminase/serine-glyoxylate transaminase/serine-pyruvate transaminase